MSYCGKQAEFTDEEYVDEEKTTNNSIQAAKVGSDDDDNENTEGEEEENINIKKIRNLFKREEYQSVLDYVQDFTGDVSLYYAGVAYFNLYLDESYDFTDRSKFLKNSESDLLEAFEKSSSDDIKEKALFQLGVISHLKSDSARSQEKAIRYFQKIREEVEDGDYYADSIWAEAYVMVKMFKRRKEAKALLMELDSVRDPYIYNFIDKIYYQSDGRKARNRIVK